MILIELSLPAAEPVTVAEAKSWARIERADEDALIGRLIAAAREVAERATGLVFGPRAFRLVVGDVPADGRVVAGRGPLIGVSALRSYDPAGRETVGDPRTVGVAGDILVLPETLRRTAGVEIEFEAGIETGKVPEGVRQAILRIVAASYEARGLVDEAMQPAIVPHFARALLAPYRRVRL